MSIILTEDQKKGLDIAVKRYNDNERYTTIAGFAGVGKSTTVKFIVEALGLNPEEDVAFATPTGKAAQVLSCMGNKNVQTIHKLLYKWHPNGDGTFTREKVNFLPYKLVVCDEVSMIDKEMINDLLEHIETHIIFLGDPF